jgi:hypothetical protein
MRVGRASFPARERSAVEVLGGDRLVRADVEDVDPVGAVPQVLDHAAMTPRATIVLPRPTSSATRNWKAGFSAVVKTVKDIVDRATLEGLQWPERRAGLERLSGHG